MELPEKPQSQWEAIEEARRRGLSVHLYGSMELQIDGASYWHVENRDRRHWFRIPKPWTVLFLYLPDKSNVNRMFSQKHKIRTTRKGFKGLPFSVKFVDYWFLPFTRWRGYHEGVGRTPIEALKSYLCEVYGNTGGLCETRTSENKEYYCEDCPLDWERD